MKAMTLTAKTSKPAHPIYYFYKLCPHPKYVGGKFVYLCGCAKPDECPAVAAAQQSKRKDTQ